MPGCLIKQNTGSVSYNNVDSNLFTAASPSSIYELESEGIFNFATSCTLPFCTIQSNYNGTTFPSILIAPDKIVYLNNTRLLIPGYSDATYLAHGQTSYTAVLDSNGYIFSSSGNIFTPISVASSPALLSGIGNVNTDITLNNASAQLNVALIGNINDRIFLNGGTLLLNGDSTLTATNCFATAGNVNLQSYTLTLRTQTMSTYETPINWESSNGTLSLMRDIVLSSTWTIEGNLFIDCNFNTINFAGGSIVVAPGAHVTIKHGRLNNIVTNSIYCADNTGVLTLYNTTWAQNGNVSFDRGTLNYKGDVLMGGENSIFTYASTATSTILTASTLELDNGFTFSYAPSNNSTTLLQFIDDSSQLILNHTTLYLAPGLHATRGSLAARQSPILYPLGQGLIFGDETITDSSADMQLIFLDNSPFTVADGAIVWQNLNSGSLQTWAGGDLEFSATATMKVYRDFDASPNGQVYFPNTGGGFYYHRVSPCPITSDVSPYPQGIFTTGTFCDYPF